MVKYQFSPILNEEKFQAVLAYIAQRSEALAQEALGRMLTVDTLTIFAQSSKEHAFLHRLVRRYGKVSSFSHGPTLYISSDLMVAGRRIKFLGLREPDPARKWVGYGDYGVEDYDAILAAKYPDVQEIITGRGQALLEIRRPDFDVLGYIVRKEEHDDGRT
jgi:hypothetical protein